MGILSPLKNFLQTSEYGEPPLAWQLGQQEVRRLAKLRLRGAS
jgi:hypothetical protein